MSNPTWLDYLSTLGSIATPLIVLVLTGFGWTIKNRFERNSRIEEAMRQDRIEVYNEVLQPFILLFMKDGSTPTPKPLQGKSKQTSVSEIVTSLEYRKTAFKFSLMGSDSVVRSYNDLMQYFYVQDLSDQRKFLDLMGKFLLEIRRSVGNENTNLHQLEMLEWFITDIGQYKKNGKY